MVADPEKPALLDVKNSLDNSGRRRRIMNFKLSFRKKKKGRYECEFMESSGSSHSYTQNRSQENDQQKSLSSNTKEEKPKGLINKLFSFKKSRRKNSCTNGDLKHNVRTKSLDLLTSDPIINDNLQNGMFSDDLGREKTAQKTAKTRKQTNDRKQNKSGPTFSLSSPNLAFVEWTSADSVSDEEYKTKTRRSSLRRSRASLVFPVSEIGSTVFTQLKHTISERNIPCRPNANKIEYSKSCLPLNASSTLTTDHHDNGDIDEMSFTVNKDILENNLLYRTPDGRSPYPGKRNICNAAFSLPEIFEDENNVKKFIDMDGSNDLINDIATVNIRSRNTKVSKEPLCVSQYSIVSKSNVDFFDDADQTSDSIFASIKDYNPNSVSKKKLGRYISCPGIVENETAFNVSKQEPSYIQMGSAQMRKLPLKPYSPHIRPFSMHEGIISSENFKTFGNKQTVSVGDYEVSQDESYPPEGKLNLPSRDLPLAFGEALWDHSSVLKTELTFSAGEMIAVYFMNNQNWWWGTKDDRKGWFPSSHVRLLVDQKLDNDEKDEEISKATRSGLAMPLHRRNTLSLLGLQDSSRTENDVRSRCVHELITSEKDYVKTLRDVSEGYLKQAWKKPDMFKPEDIAIVFGNIEQIYKFHKKFYQEILKRIDQKQMYKSQVAELFVFHSAEFEIYSEYCNNHPNACARLLELQKEKRYKLFFESCRLLQQMISLSIDAFLLTPVQKICKYPLQLNELLKHTPVDHPDHEHLQAAVQVMRDVASSINERKRKFENLSSLAEWQLNVDSWQGDDLLEKSSELIKRGLIERLNGLKLEEIHLSLFDHQLIICRKDSYKKNSRLLFLERVNLDHATFESMNETSGQTSQYLIKVVDAVQNVTHLLSTRTAEERDKWLKVFIKERQIVKNEKRTGYAIPETVRIAAMQSARTKKTSESKKEHRRRKSLTDPFQGLEFGANVIRRSFRLRRTQSLREKRTIKVSK